MSPRTGGFVVLVFAGIWLWVGVAALPMPWAVAVGAIGVAVLLAVARHVRHSPAPIGSGVRFHRPTFYAAVAFEVVAANLAGWQLGRLGLVGYIWPALGMVVALHFVGLWWASHDPRYLTLMLVMLAVNVVACLFASGGRAMLAVCGLGSSAALAGAMVRR